MQLWLLSVNWYEFIAASKHTKDNTYVTILTTYTNNNNLNTHMFVLKTIDEKRWFIQKSCIILFYLTKLYTVLNLNNKMSNYFSSSSFFQRVIQFYFVYKSYISKKRIRKITYILKKFNNKFDDVFEHLLENEVKNIDFKNNVLIMMNFSDLNMNFSWFERNDSKKLIKIQWKFFGYVLKLQGNPNL